MHNSPESKKQTFLKTHGFSKVSVLILGPNKLNRFSKVDFSILHKLLNRSE